MKFRTGAILGLGLAFAVNAQAWEPNKPECIAPAKPGGGFDLTCRIVSNGFADAKLLPTPMQVTFMLGGIGAVAINYITANRRNDGDALVAFSSGSLLNIAEGKFGRKIDANSVRWLASAGVDYGAVVVRGDSPYHSLKELMNAIKENPRQFVFGAGGSVGSQDWMKAAILVKAIGVDPRKIRYVAYEGGGDASAALLGNHIQIYTGDVGELTGLAKSDKIRVLAILSDKHVEGELANVPTAKEQGYDVEWPILRGYYVGPEVSDEAYNYWVNQFKKAYDTPAFNATVKARELQPFKMAGPEFVDYVNKRIKFMHGVAKDAGLVR